jgi:hypothetical protein
MKSNSEFSSRDVLRPVSSGWPPCSQRCICACPHTSTERTQAVADQVVVAFSRPQRRRRRVGRAKQRS